jgi:type VI secretion system secreted protein VgrG
LLGQNITVHYQLPIGGTRHFNGFVSEFSYVGSLGEQAHYQAVMRPWYWLLTRTADSRIFQFMSVPDILKAVFADNGFSDYETRLYGDYREWDYCVQYRETDYNFLARLMEQEGIYYYFRHEAGKHILVLADAISAHDPYPGYERVTFHSARNAILKEHLHAWRVGQRIQPGKIVLNDYNFQTPRADLESDRPMPRPHAHADHEIYDYPGEYTDRGEGENYARIRIEELQASHTLMHGQGNVGGIAPGHLFSLERHPRADQNQDYLVLAADYTLHSEDYESGGHAEGTSYDVAFSVLPASEPYRPPRLTPKPIVQGPQTAVVTGPPGEEIYPDRYGRVKVQFHWDRYGQRNEHSSCWIRVSQAWAGKGWGAMIIPRIGQEVIVDFLEGDPDRPIITGRVYNADNMPPYGLPANNP